MRIAAAEARVSSLLLSMLEYIPLPQTIFTLSTRLRAWHHLFQARLSRQIVLWVFASIIVIEAIILLPSVYRRRQELLRHLKEVSSAQVMGVVHVLGPHPAERVLMEQIKQSSVGTQVRGGALYRSTGQLVGTFGEPPDLSFDAAQHNQNADRLTPQGDRYDAVWAMSPLSDQYLLIIRHDATAVEQELIAFIGRVVALVLLISIFVTVVTLIGLEPLLITPILSLRRDLLAAGAAVRRDEDPPQFESVSLDRGDELGDVIVAFDQMYQQVSEAMIERKEAEMALRQSEEKFSMAFHSSPNPMMISTLADGRILEVNESFLRLYGATENEVVGRTGSELKLWAKPEYRTEMLKLLQQSGRIRNEEYTFHTQAGEPRTISFSTEMVHVNGQKCLVSVFNDITDLKQAEQALERLAEIGELAAMIVHEVRNPLTTVLMGLNSFRQLDLPDRAQARLDLALDEADRLQRLLNEILNYTRCQKLIEPECIELNAFITEMLDSVCSMPAAQGRTIQFISSAEPAWMMGDRDKLKQIWINLITNACEAIDSGETITWSIETSAIHQLIYVRIYNRGSLIPADILPHLTKPFYTTKSTGSGLGLAIVKRIVEAHYGELDIESSETSGTIVTVKLPLFEDESTI